MFTVHASCDVSETSLQDLFVPFGHTWLCFYNSHTVVFALCASLLHFVGMFYVFKAVRIIIIFFLAIWCHNGNDKAEAE